MLNKEKARYKRHRRIRKNVYGISGKPRFNVFKSINHIYAQIIDDSSGTTIVSASSIDKEIKEKFSTGGNVEAARTVGDVVAKKAIGKGIRKVVFDRGGYLYHGRVKALADAARAAGLEF